MAAVAAVQVAAAALAVARVSRGVRRLRAVRVLPGMAAVAVRLRLAAVIAVAMPDVAHAARRHLAQVAAAAKRYAVRKENSPACRAVFL